MTAFGTNTKPLQVKKWYVVDPLAKSRYVLFDNADMAAQVTRIVKNPFDAQHLAVENLKFTDDEKHVRFEVRSTKDTVKSKDELAKLKNKADSIKKKTYFLEYTIATKQLREIADTLKEKDKPYWASVSPDTNKVFFAKNYNIYWMDRANLEKAIKDDKDSTIVEHQVTKDGMQYYAWGGDQYSVTTGNDKDEDESKKRQPVRLSWSPDGKYFALTRKDNRHLNPLWVINNVGQKRPTLETYKYLVPGETDSTEAELYIFNAANFNAKQVSIGAFKNQTIAIYGKDQDKSSYKGKHFISYWLGDNQEFYVTRGSRDLKRIDIVAVSINGDVRTVVEERSNVYQDIKTLLRK